MTSLNGQTQVEPESENGTMISPKASTSSFVVFMNVTNTITHFVLGAVAFSAIFFINNFGGSSHLKQHIYLCVIGYVILMSQAILSLNPHTSFANNLKYPQKRLIHLVMQVAGSIFALVGSIIRISNVTEHFQSLHGIFGFIAMVLTTMSLLGGILKLFLVRPLSKTIPRTLHSCVGALTLVCAFLCLCFGFSLEVYRSNAGDVNANLSIGLTLIGLIGTLLMTFVNLTRRLLSSFNN